MTETGRLAVFKAPGEPFELREYPLPEVEPGAVLLKTIAASICGTDLHVWRGDLGPDFGPAGRRGAASPLGHEMVGRVHRLGKGVTADAQDQPLHEGDRVTFAYFHPCRQCPVCASGDLYACPNTGYSTAVPLGKHPYFTGAFADYHYLWPGHIAFKVPDDISDDLAATVNCAFSQVVFGLQKAQVGFGERVVIQGAGGLGLYATAVARERGASSVIVVDGQSARLKLAKRMGADATVDMNDYPTADARVERVEELTGGVGADVVVGLVGFASAFAEGLRMARRGGRHLEIGAISSSDTVTISPSSLVHGRTTIMGVGIYDPWIIPKTLDFIVRTKDRYPYHEILSNRYPLEEIDRAFRESEWRGGKSDQTAVTRALITP